MRAGETQLSFFIFNLRPSLRSISEDSSPSKSFCFLTLDIFMSAYLCMFKIYSLMYVFNLGAYLVVFACIFLFMFMAMYLILIYNVRYMYYTVLCNYVSFTYFFMFFVLLCFLFYLFFYFMVLYLSIRRFTYAYSY